MEQQKPFFLAQEKDNLIIIRMGGDINASTLPEWRDLIDELIEKHEINKRNSLRILVDYKQVTDVDSATVANILERINEHEKRQHVIGYINVPDELKEMIKIHKLENTVMVFDTEEEAIKELTKRTQ